MKVRVGIKLDGKHGSAWKRWGRSCLKLLVITVISLWSLKMRWARLPKGLELWVLTPVVTLFCHQMSLMGRRGAVSWGWCSFWIKLWKEQKNCWLCARCCSVMFVMSFDPHRSPHVRSTDKETGPQKGDIGDSLPTPHDTPSEDC